MPTKNASKSNDTVTKVKRKKQPWGVTLWINPLLEYPGAIATADIHQPPKSRTAPTIRFTVTSVHECLRSDMVAWISGLKLLMQKANEVAEKMRA